MKKKLIAFIATLVCSAVLVSPISTCAKTANFLPGDVNGDGLVNVDDLSLLNRYLNADDDIDLVYDNGDINEDSNIDNNDLTILQTKVITKIKGDVDGNGIVNIDDANRLKKYLVGTKVEFVKENTDFNGDNSIDILDLQLLYEKLNTNIKGDVNGDGVLDTDDYMLLKEYITGKEKSIVQKNGNLNGDDVINVADLVELNEKLTINIKGDVNGDGVVNEKDINNLKAYLMDSDVKIVNENSDLNGDGAIDISDLMGLNKIIYKE
ncbi:dockerin type I domain-containing protein [Clostridium cibarium]|uniref:Dockerin domain-containing protein n=1 Tax=Clostridium cibarium TaxID=2762247 RepID=A0ABR8PSK1_9CLOT|nr:dockerin type I domain-containing protein [Clostridium cibarium]MBD7911142.1 hypothetical protein [Clostridium cibarium]